MQYTNEQLLAVETRGRNLLVSAAAGSGKTRVLVGRVLDRVLREQLPLSEFLIITFTRAAASELRDRLASGISELAAQYPQNRHLRRQLSLCGSANIMTIDSFCSSLVREFSHLCTLPPSFRIAEGAELELIREEALAAALERIYGEQDGDGELAAFTASLSFGRFDTSIVGALTALHRAVYAHPFPEEWMARCSAAYDAPSFAETGFCAVLAGAARSAALSARDMVAAALHLLYGEPVLAAKYMPAFSSDLELCDRLISALDEGWDEARRALDNDPVRLSAAPRGYPDPAFRDNLKAMRESFKKMWTSLRDSFSASAEELTAEMWAQRPAIRGALKAAQIFHEEFSELKRSRSIADFGDLSRATAALLTQPGENGEHLPSAIAAEVGARYAEILIDEFQDTNSVQTLIAETLTADRHSLFMVGDVKQSIYRFRLAEPELFLERYRRFSHLDGAADGEAAKIILSKNFRSSECVVGAVNWIFSSLMRGGVAQISYGEDERLYCGREDTPSPEMVCEFHLLERSASANASATGTGTGTGADADTGDAPDSPDALELEAQYVAGRISEMLGTLEIPDESGDGKRPLRAGDVAILLRSTARSASAYEQALAAHGIPAYSGTGVSLTAELRVMASLLEVIENPYRDVPLIAALRSPVFGFSSDELAEVRCARKDAGFYEALLAASETMPRAREFLDTVAAFRTAAGQMPVDRLIMRIYSETGLPGIYSAMQDGARRRDNLNRLYQCARSYESASPFGLSGFLDYLRRSFGDGSFFSDTPSSSDCVRIMTIHRSKGLEFPVVFVCGLAGKFNFDDTRGALLTHPSLGVGMKYPDLERGCIYSSAPWLALSSALRDETVAEELRVLYVAFTRAKEKLVLTGMLPSTTQRIPSLITPEPGDELLRRATDPLRLLLPVLARHPDGRPLREFAAVNFDPDACGRFEVHIAQVSAEPEAAQEAAAQDRQPISEEYLRDVARLLDYEYPHTALGRIPSKLTATELKGHFLDSEAEDDAVPSPAVSRSRYANAAARQLRRPAFAAGDSLTAAERGTALHLAMQHVHLESCTDERCVSAELESLRARGILDARQAEAADPVKIVEFARSGLCRRAIASGTLRREFKFSLLCEASEYYPELPRGEQILLQGVCDFFFVENGGITLVDFKTDRIQSGMEAERAEVYRAQLECYASALERIFDKKVRERIIWFFETGGAALL